MALDTLIRDITIQPEQAQHASEIEALVDRVFGPGRFVKTAERLREDSSPVAELSFVALKDGQVVGTVRLWPVFVWNEADNSRTPLVFLGPICVEPSLKGQGIGRSLVTSALKATFNNGFKAVLLVGTRAYFEPFGFTLAQGISLPGPVDPNRLLICYNDGAEPMNGLVVKVLKD